MIDERIGQELSAFPVGDVNPVSEYFSGVTYLAPLTNEQVPAFNVTFAPGCRNNWHVHHAAEGGGQMLLCVYGHGWYQEWGKEAVAMTPGTIIAIPEGVKHWHGAAKDSWFQHLTYHKDVREGASNEWLEPVSDAQYNVL